jgi:uncharacterized protein (TIGR02118 family)
MVKIVYCARKRADLSDEEFHDYWLNQHGALVRRVAPAIRCKRYTQSHIVAMPELHEIMRATRLMQEPYDGIAELWWDSLDDFMDAYSSAEGLEGDAELREDEAKFIDLAASCIFLTEENVILDSGGGSNA